MILYPSIPRFDDSYLDRNCYVYPKHDGSNLGFEWSKSRGWFRQRTRNRLFDSTDPIFGRAINLFKPIGSQLIERIKPKQNIIVFVEALSPGGFAGSHFNPIDNLIVFDICINERFLDPIEYQSIVHDLSDNFTKGQHLEITHDYVDYVRDSLYVEGVIFKGIYKKEIWRCKLKSTWYLNELRNKNLEDS